MRRAYNPTCSASISELRRNRVAAPRSARFRPGLGSSPPSISMVSVPDPIVANARPAATVVVLRDGPAGPEVFMVRRHEGTAFMGGAHVFPGGRVDAADGDADADWCDGLDHAAGQLEHLPRADALAYNVAAIRELFEEAGVLLARHPDGDFVSLATAADHERLKADRSRVLEKTTTLRAVIEREGLRLALDALVLFAH